MKYLASKFLPMGTITFSMVLTVTGACSSDGESPGLDDSGGAGVCSKMRNGCGGGGESKGGEGGERSTDCVKASLHLLFESSRVPELDRATDFIWLDANQALFASAEGNIHWVEKQGAELIHRRTYPIEEEIYTEEACGLTNLLLAPGFDGKGAIYVSYCTSPLVTRLVRYNFSLEAGLTAPRVIFETVLPAPSDEWHRYGSMGFEEDGRTLWMLVGDHFVPEYAQALDNPMGKLVRIIPDEDGRGFTPARGNLAEAAPQLGAGGEASVDVDPSIFAYGFRSPWRGTRDRFGRIFVGDVGLTTTEEVNLVTQVGQNFGWPVFEGACSGACSSFVDPVASYGRDSDDPYVLEDPLTAPATKRAIWVGEIYSSAQTDRYCGLMDDVVPFGDLFTGWVRGLRVSRSGAVQLDIAMGHLGNVTAWRVGPDGFAYALTLDGTLHRAVLEER